MKVLSGIVNQFVIVVYQHLYLALFGTDDHALVAHAAHHVKRVAGFSPKGQFQSVVFDTLIEGFLQGRVDLEEPVGRAQTPNALVGALVVVVLDPKGNPIGGIFVAGKLRPLQKLGQDALPEPFDLSQSHGMVGAGTDMLDPVLGKFFLETGSPSPVGILSSVVGEHLLGHTVLSNGPAVGLDHVLGGLAAVKSQAGDVAAVIVQVANQVGVFPGQTKRQDVALPHLVGSGPLEKAGLGRILFGLLFNRCVQPLIAQGPLDGGGAGLNQKKPLEDIGDASDPVSRVFLFQVDDTLADGTRQL